MNILKQILVLFICLSSLFAQTPEETAEHVYLANINTLLIFTSESGLSSGHYRFTNSEYKMQTYTLPFVHHFKSFDKKMNWFVNGSFGYSIARLDTQTITQRSGADITLNHDNKLQTYTGGLGGGIRYKTGVHIDLLASIGLIYSRVGTSVKPKDDIGGAIEDFFNSQYNDNITYKFFLGAEYKKEIEGFKSYLKAGFKSYETKADFSFDALTGFTTQSNITSLSLGLETPSVADVEDNYLSLEPYIKMNYLQGDITETVKFDKFLNMGVVAYWNTPKVPFWAERFYMEFSTVRAKGLEGYNVGIGFSLDY